MDPLRSELDLRLALERVAAEGAAFVPRALEEGFRQRLQDALERLRFEPAPEVVGPVRQQMGGAEVPREKAPEAELLRDAFEASVRDAAANIRGLATWRPNEVFAQRYRAGAMGITPHLDGKRYRRLVAVFTTHGSARFAICRSREGEVIAEWTTGPGSLVLLRGPGLAGHRDGRPFHLVDGPRRGWRYSVGLRMDTRH